MDEARRGNPKTDGRDAVDGEPGWNRRELIGLGAVATIGLAACGARGKGGAAGASPGTSFVMEEATIGGLQEALASGELSSEQLCRLYLERIGSLDDGTNGLHSVIETDPGALRVAGELDRERAAGRVRGALHGIPVLLKDNIATAGPMQTTAGSLALVDLRPPAEAPLVRRLREAGAVILGKTNLSEWANFRSTHSSSGWSGRGGQCRNPYVLDRSPCGSSSGSAAAVSANLAALAVGTETDGSVVCPSATCGVVGIKPTLGRVSRTGIIPIAHSQDTAGPMARTVRDAAILLAVMSGADPQDAATRAPGAGPLDLAGAFDPGDLKGVRLGVARKRLTGYSPKTDAAFEKALEVLAGLGAELVDPADIPHLGEYDDAEWTVLLYEFKTDLEAWLAGLGPDSPIRTLDDLIEFNRANADREMPWFGQEIFEMAAEKGSLEEPEYRKALETCRRLAKREGLDAALDVYRVDAIVAPTGGPAWTIDLVNGDHFSGSSSSPAAVSGNPAVTVPMGFVAELPVGITFMGRAWDEARLVRIAWLFEQASAARKPPRLLPTLPV